MSLCLVLFSIMEEEPKDVIVLGAIRSGAKKFDKIASVTKIKPDELNKILEKLEERGLISVNEKKGFFGPKIEITTTEKGSREIDERIHELQEEWGQMVTLYKSGDKKKLKEYMDEKRSFFPTMMYFGIIDMMMFSMMPYGYDKTRSERRCKDCNKLLYVFEVGEFCIECSRKQAKT